MQVFDFYPMGAAGGGCIVTGDYDVSNGKRVISLDLDLDSLPTNGLLCLSEEAVRQLNTALGWIADEAGQERIVALTERAAVLEAANAELTGALRGISVSQDLLVPVAERVEVIPAPVEEAERPTGPYEDRTKAQLLERAAELGIEGVSGLNKAEIIDALRAN